MHPDDRPVALALAAHRFNFISEKQLQAGIENALLEAGCLFYREYRLDAHSTVDFMFTSGLAAEVKIKGSAAAAIRQLHRYAQFDKVKRLLLITSKATHAVPTQLNGKPVSLLRIGTNPF